VGVKMKDPGAKQKRNTECGTRKKKKTGREVIARNEENYST
jgi:hypothetical protein